MNVDDLARLLSLREATASVAPDGETIHAPQTDWLYCLDHARERIAELEAEKRVIVAELTALREQVTWIPTDVRIPPMNERVLGVYQIQDEHWQQWAIFTWHPESGWWDEALCEPLGADCAMVYWRPVPRLPGDSKEVSDGDAAE